MYVQSLTNPKQKFSINCLRQPVTMSLKIIISSVKHFWRKLQFYYPTYLLTAVATQTPSDFYHCHPFASLSAYPPSAPDLLLASLHPNHSQSFAAVVFPLIAPPPLARCFICSASLLYTCPSHLLFTSVLISGFLYNSLSSRSFSYALFSFSLIGPNNFHTFQPYPGKILCYETPTSFFNLKSRYKLKSTIKYSNTNNQILFDG